jgi:YaiO family outer membrane protein
MKAKHNLICGLLLSFLSLSKSASTQRIDSSRNRSVTAIYEYNKFSESSNYHWQLASLEYKGPVGQTTVVGRVNFADRWGNTGWQAELDAYPRISKKMYAYTSIGAAPNALVFPKWRAGASLYFNLPMGIELEGGARYLHFSEDLWMLTAGVGKYLGNWLFQGRSFLSLRNNLGADHSFAFTARYYLPSGKDYIWGQLGSGVSPDESQGAQLQISNLHRYTVAGGVRTTIAGKHLLLATLGFARNEFRKDMFGEQLTGTIGYGIKF